MAKIDLTNGAAPATPSLGKVSVYSKADKNLYIKDDAGLETLLSSTATNFVPYTGATANVNLGAFGLTSKNATFGDAGALGNYFTLTASTRKVTIGNFATAGFVGISLFDTPSITNYTLLSDNVSTFLNTAAGGIIYFRHANVAAAQCSLSSFIFNNDAKVLNTNPILYLENTAANSATSGRLEFRSTGGAEYAYFTFDASANFFRQFYQTTEVYRINSSGQMQWRDGSAGAPAISFLNDTNTGFFRYSADIIGVAASGSLVTSIGSTGLGMFGTNPNNTHAHIISPSMCVTGGTYGFNCYNSVDNIFVKFKSPDYSYTGVIESDCSLSLVSGISIAGTQPNIDITSGVEASYNMSGNITISVRQTSYGSAGVLGIYGGGNNYSNGGDIIVEAGAVNSGYGGEYGGAITISGGQTYTGSGYGGSVTVAPGTGSYGNGYLYLNSTYPGDTYLNTSGGQLLILEASTSSYISFFGVGAVNQQTTLASAATLVGGAGTTLTDTDTFDGYTVAQIVGALRAYGLLA